MLYGVLVVEERKESETLFWSLRLGAGYISPKENDSFLF